MKGKMNKWLVGIFAIASVAITSCSEVAPKPPEIPSANVEIHLNHVFGSEPFAINDKYFMTENNDSFQPARLTYHINNFEFETATGEIVKPETQYFMVDFEQDATPTLDMGELEGKTFTKMRFTIGVADSTTNADGLLNGLFLDPMYWSMAAGYINFKIEGKSPSVSNNIVILHLGGYMGDYKLNHTYELDLTENNARSEIGHNKIMLQMDVAELFRDPNTIDLSVINDIMSPNDQAKMLVENFATMMSVTSVE